MMISLCEYSESCSIISNCDGAKVNPIDWKTKTRTLFPNQQEINGENPGERKVGRQNLLNNLLELQTSGDYSIQGENTKNKLWPVAGSSWFSYMDVG